MQIATSELAHLQNSPCAASLTLHLIALRCTIALHEVLC